jgi:hypothetical protein
MVYPSLQVFSWLVSNDHIQAVKNGFTRVPDAMIFHRPLKPANRILIYDDSGLC